MRELNFKQRLFVEAYLGEAKGNATEAARIAGYAWPEKQGYQQLEKTRIKAAVERRLNSAALSTSEILARLSDHATATLEDFIEIDDQGHWSIAIVKAKKRGRLHTARKIKSGEFGPEIEIQNPMEALKVLAQFRGITKPETMIVPSVGDDRDRKPHRIKPRRSPDSSGGLAVDGSDGSGDAPC